jgi:hypothetical protein
MYAYNFSRSCCKFHDLQFKYFLQRSVLKTLNLRSSPILKFRIISKQEVKLFLPTLIFRFSNMGREHTAFCTEC